MPLRDSAVGYGRLSQALHWLTVLLVLEQVTLAFTWGSQPAATRNGMIDTHRSFGILVLCLTALRLAWHALGPRLAPAPGLPAWQRRLSQGVHALLYALLIAIPLAGWAHTSAIGRDVVVLGATLPRLVAADPALGDATAALHNALAFALIGLASLHALAGLRHAMLGDGATRRML